MPGRNLVIDTVEPSSLRRSPRLSILRRSRAQDQIISTVISQRLKASSAPAKPIYVRKSPRFSSQCRLSKSENTINVRRSPRFLQRDEFPGHKYREPYQRKSGKNRVRSSNASVSAVKDSRLNLHKEFGEKTKEESSNANLTSSKSEDTNTGLRKFTRLINGDEDFMRLRKSSRLSNLRNDDAKCEYRLRKASNEAMAAKNVPKNLKNVHCRSRNNPRSENGREQSQALRKSQRLCSQPVSYQYDDTKGHNSFTEGQGRISNSSHYRGSIAVDKERKESGINSKISPLRRKRKQDDNGTETQGWTIEQEAMLQRAYYAAKPTPNFWKMVSKLVPGKSAQECFDKVYSKISTPPQPRPRSRMKTSPLKHLIISENEILKLDDPKGKLLNRYKRNRHLVKKQVRHILQKNSEEDQDSEIDLFSILEPEELQPIENLSTPDDLKKKSRSLRDKKKPRSRFSVSSNIVSPPVLKQVKNKVLHERYIDQLHCREAKRKAMSAKMIRSAIEDQLKNHQVVKVDVVEAAKQALVSDARDAISHFKHLQAKERSFSPDLEGEQDYFSGSEDNEDDEDKLETF